MTLAIKEKTAKEENGLNRIQNNLEHDFSIDVTDKRILRIFHTKRLSRLLNTAITVVSATHSIHNMGRDCA